MVFPSCLTRPFQLLWVSCAMHRWSCRLVVYELMSSTVVSKGRKGSFSMACLVGLVWLHCQDTPH